MKLINKYILMAAASLSIAACSQDDGLGNSYLNDSDAVRITAQIGSNEATGGFTTRSNPLGGTDEQTKFNKGDAISVAADNQDAVVYSYDGTNWSPKEKGLHIVWNSDEMDFKAFYPANANGASFTDFTLPTAYNSLEDIALGDYMTFSAKCKRETTNNGVNLEMERKMVRMVVNVSSWGNAMGDDWQVKEVTIHPNTNGYSNGELVAANSENVNVKAYKHTDGKFYALITPTKPVEDIYNYLLFMTVKIAKSDGSSEQELQVRRIPPLGTVAGNSYEYSLKVGKDELVVDKITVSDWKTGEAIPGGEALGDVEFVKKRIADALTKGETNIELSLQADAGEDVFQAIQNSLEEATDGSIELTIKGCTEIPDDALCNRTGKFNALKSVSLPNVKKIGRFAFANCSYFEEIYAPNASSIQSNAFGTCPRLNKVILGNITEAIGSHNSYDGIFDPDANTEKIDLYLSEEQKCMESIVIGSDMVWRPTEDYYKRSNDFTFGLFLGYKFQSVNCINS